ncbi:MAG: biotin--[acetyl-CoA-carboxylase] ligase [Gammaproteobacteria bacterium]|nr:biotin--[acetyl-CoA-carboxylase] ligase [Gammaproteobacteria bacterium]
MSARSSILEVLSDGNPRSAREIANAVGLSPSAVHYQIEKLSRLGLDIVRIDRRDYCLRAPLRPLDRRTILKYLAAHADPAAGRFYLREEIGSTSLFLLRQRALVPGSVCVAERQTAGRGRRGRGWIATPFCNVLLSISWRLSCGAALISGLSLAAGIAVVRALADYGVSARLKWPNDVVWQGRKLGGVLLDVRHEAHGSIFVVVGVGINAYIAPLDASKITQPWVDVTSITATAVDRNRLVAQLVRRLRETLHTFEHVGFGYFRQEWERLHIYNGQRVCIVAGAESVIGRVVGTDTRGALRLQDENGGLRVFQCGDVRLRPMA